MELYVYQSPRGLVADYRPYLDGRDHSFDDHRALPQDDPRWEKIRNLLHPDSKETIGGELSLVGRAECQWRELMLFPIAWDQGFEPVEVE
jgi:hypothetical protein